MHTRKHAHAPARAHTPLIISARCRPSAGPVPTDPASTAYVSDLQNKVVELQQYIVRMRLQHEARQTQLLHDLQVVLACLSPAQADRLLASGSPLSCAPFLARSTARTSANGPAHATALDRGCGPATRACADLFCPCGSANGGTPQPNSAPGCPARTAYSPGTGSSSGGGGGNGRDECRSTGGNAGSDKPPTGGSEGPDGSAAQDPFLRTLLEMGFAQFAVDALLQQGPALSDTDAVFEWLQRFNFSAAGAGQQDAPLAAVLEPAPEPPATGVSHLQQVLLSYKELTRYGLWRRGAGLVRGTEQGVVWRVHGTMVSVRP